jgi:hypothetical protein
MFGFDLYSQNKLDYEGLRNVARAIMLRMESAIYDGDYSFDKI